MKRSLSTSKSKFQKKTNYICFERNILFWCQKEDYYDFSKIPLFSETIIMLIFKTETWILLLFLFFCMHIIQKKILEKNEQKMKFVIAETKLHEICKILCHC